MPKPVILLVEDNATYRKAVKLTMEVSGFAVLEAENGKQGLEQIKMQKPDVIVSDINMPEMDGITMVKEIKKQEELKAVPVIMLTNVQEEIENSVKIGADEAMLKSSLTPHQVVDVCKRYLQTG